MSRCEITAKAKINLSLDVLRKRDDGYHDMRMVMQDVDLCDTITVEETSSGQICLTTNVRFLPTDERNLAYRAAQAFYRETGMPLSGIDIKVEKRIPVAAGLAGGSTNAAGVLKALNELYGTGLSCERLRAIGKALGADVPYCIFGGTALAESIGDVLTKLSPLPDCRFVIACPSIPISTKRIFEKLDFKKIKYRPDTKGMIDSLEKGDLGGVSRRMLNVMELVTAAEHKIIGEIKKVMIEYGALGATMSGTGPSVFGVFEPGNDISRLQNKLLGIVPTVFVADHRMISE